MRNRIDAKDKCDVLVGGHVFTIDRDLFLRRSAVLRKAGEEANNQPPDPSTLAVIKSEDAQNCDARTFSMYKRFVEAGDIDIIDKEDTLPFLIQIHALAWQLEDYTAANTSIDKIIDAILEEHTSPNLDHILQEYESASLAFGCPLKRLMVDFQIHDPRSMSFLYFDDDNPENLIDFFQDVILEYRGLTLRKGNRGRFGKANDIFGNKPGDRDVCHHYHKHDKDHKDTECCEVSSEEEGEESEEDSEEVEQESEESGQEGRRRRATI